MCLNLAQFPEVRERALLELSTIAPEGSLASIENLVRLEYLRAMTFEVRRSNRLFATSFFEIAKSPVSYAGYDIPAGWKTTGVIFQTMQDESVFPEPGRFDPERFLAPRLEHETSANSYIPHGGGAQDGHRCPAEDFTTLLMQLTAATLLRGYEWELAADQDLSLSGGPSPVPRDGISVRFRKKAGSG